MITNFAGKTAVVTGGASGIGLAITEACAAKGMNVLIADIEKTVMNDVVARFQSEQGARVEGVLVDVTDQANINEMYEAARDTFGNVHMLVNNAGVGGGGPIAETDLETWRPSLGHSQCRPRGWPLSSSRRQANGTKPGSCSRKHARIA